MAEEYRAVFRGRRSFWSGWVKEENGKIFVDVPHNKFPWLKEKKLLVSNIRQHLKNYTEIKMMDIGKGLSDQTVRFFPFDIDTFEPFYPDMNPDLLRELESLRQERDLLFQHSKELEEAIERHGMSDVLKKNFKAEHDYFMSLKPGVIITKDKEKKKKKL